MHAVPLDGEHQGAQAGEGSASDAGTDRALLTCRRATLRQPALHDPLRLPVHLRQHPQPKVRQRLRLPLRGFRAGAAATVEPAAFLPLFVQSCRLARAGARNVQVSGNSHRPLALRPNCGRRSQLTPSEPTHTAQSGSARHSFRCARGRSCPATRRDGGSSTRRCRRWCRAEGVRDTARVWVPSLPPA